jgi:tetraacyldisaccharide 4'-kinase
VRSLLFPAGILYRSVTGMRNWMYDHRLFKAAKVDSKVISIGNLTVGGTGKTPVALAIVDMIKKRGHSVAVISRGYKREQKGVLEVDTSQYAALTFGDEPALIKHTFPDIPVVVAEKRVLAAKSVLDSRSVDFVICDDAFQHRALHRDLNILLFDASESVKNYRVLPVGMAREALQPALRRADIVILTKANLVSPEALTERVDWITTRCNKPVVLAEYVFQGLRNMSGEQRESLRDAAILVSGVAKPEAVERTLEGKVKVLNHRKFDDHHRYTDLEVETLLDESASSGARWILTTGKDAMKLGAFARLRDRLWVIELGVQFKGEVQALNEAIDGLARAGG